MDRAEIGEFDNGLLFYGKASVTDCTKIKGQDNVYSLKLTATYERTSQLSPLPGQFYLLKSERSSVQLDRPISVYSAKDVFTSEGRVKNVELEFLILEKGAGTKELCHLMTGDKVELIGPLGNTFKLPESINLSKDTVCIVGGGIGVAPVANFASSLPLGSYDFYASYRSGSYGLENIRARSLVITTDDGSEGIHGMLSAALTASKIKEEGYKCIFACGPAPMLNYVKKVACECGVKAYLSLENYMACGVGACLGCTVKTTEGNKRVCKDGPVFDADIVEFDKPAPRRQTGNNIREPDLSVNIKGVKFNNPVIAASGTFGFGQNYRGIFDVNLLGGICSKGCTLNPKEGNEGRRIVEVTGGNINSIGLENPGIPHFIQYELREMLKLKPVAIANLAGSDIDSYAKGAELLDKSDVPVIELNISCPNVKSGGMAWGMESKTAGTVVKAVREATSKPLIVKLSPNAPDLKAVALACIENGADALSLVNTFQAIAIDINTGKPVFNNIRAGMCGPAIKPIALRMVYDVVEAINTLPEEKRVPVIGIGGISTWQDAVEFIMAGACAVEVGSATFSNPNAMIEIIDGLRNFMIKNGYSSIKDFCGCAQVN